MECDGKLFSTAKFYNPKGKFLDASEFEPLFDFAVMSKTRILSSIGIDSHDSRRFSTV
jgi:hypothetical protein